MASRAHLRPWRELYRALIEPVEAFLPKAPGSRLTIVPHGPLFRLSFAALQDPQGRYLLERYDLHYVPAAGVLQFTSTAHPEPTATGAASAAAPTGAAGTTAATAATPTGATLKTNARTIGRALLVSDPGSPASPLRTSSTQAPQSQTTTSTPQPTTATTAAKSEGATTTARASEIAPASLPPLTYARREVEAIAKLLPGPSDTLLGADATESAVRQQLASHRLIHFATLGVVHNDPTLDSYLAIRRAGSAADVDGHLTASEIDALTLDADLVVLSACGTALGPISGDGVQGFTRAFLAAGAGSVVATEWSVADRTSYPVMTGFYRYWLSGRSKSRALRQAQLAMLRQLRAGHVSIDGVTLHESPWLWAGFVLVGNP
jgi:CHAT domain-containing protein